MIALIAEQPSNCCQRDVSLQFLCGYKCFVLIIRSSVFAIELRTGWCDSG
jgi:hypothetical protein